LGQRNITKNHRNHHHPLTSYQTGNTSITLTQQEIDRKTQAIMTHASQEPGTLKEVLRTQTQEHYAVFQQPLGNT